MADRPETPGERAFRLQLEAQCRRIAEQIAEQALPGTGFALLMFDFGADGNLAYVSNAQRADMRRALREWLATTAQPGDPEYRSGGRRG